MRKHHRQPVGAWPYESTLYCCGKAIIPRSEEIREEVRGRLVYSKLMLKGTMSLGKLLLTSAADVRRIRQTQQSEEHYARPPRRYDLPEYSGDLPYFDSTSRYLRPTRHCNPRAPEVVVLANALGAYQKSDHEFTRAAYEFVKEKTVLEIGPIGSVEETLRRATGTCFELISVFIALCRAAGIPARYKIYATDMIRA